MVTSAKYFNTLYSTVKILILIGSDTDEIRLGIKIGLAPSSKSGDGT